MANTVSISASVSDSRYITVTGTFNNNHGSWNSSVPCSTSVDGVGSNSHTLNIQKNSPSWSDTYDVGTSYSARTYTCRVYCYQWGSFQGNTDASTTVTVPAVARPASVPGSPSNVKAVFTAPSASGTGWITVSWTNNQPSSGGISANILQVNKDDTGWKDVSTSISGSSTSYQYKDGSNWKNGKYKFRVASKNSAGTSAYTESAVVYSGITAPDLIFGCWYPKAGATVADITNEKMKNIVSMYNATATSTAAHWYVGKVTWKVGYAKKDCGIAGQGGTDEDGVFLPVAGGANNVETGSTTSISLSKEDNDGVYPGLLGAPTGGDDTMIYYDKDNLDNNTIFVQCYVETPDGQNCIYSDWTPLTRTPQIWINSDADIKNIYLYSPSTTKIEGSTTSVSTKSEVPIKNVYFKTE